MKEVFELGVYRLSEALADMIWYNFETWSVKAKITIGHQVIRSSDSIAANIAERYGRYTPADRKKVYQYARGSFEKTKSRLRKTVRPKGISTKRSKDYKSIIDELGPKLNAFITSIGRNIN